MQQKRKSGNLKIQSGSKDKEKNKKLPSDCVSIIVEHPYDEYFPSKKEKNIVTPK